MSQLSKISKNQVFHLSEFLWDIWCVVSVIGIWPRFIEPNLLQVTHRSICLSGLPESLKGLKIVQFSDLHFQESMSNRFLRKLTRKIHEADPDLLVFTGDFLCYSHMNEEDKERLQAFLNSLKARYGCYAIFGNHDYAQYVSINDEGEYDLLPEEENRSLIKRGFDRLLKTITLAKKVTPRAQAVQLNEALVDLLQKTPFQLLENAHRCIKIKGGCLNICGLGEYSLGKTDPKKAFQEYNRNDPGLILLHNPDGLPLLEGYPGEIILCGHTHGGQVNLPWMWRKFTLMENERFKRGLVHDGGRWIYVNRGIGSCFSFRWFALPELLILTLQPASAPSI